MNDMTKKVQELMELRRMAEELETEIAGLQDAIKAELTSRNTDELIAGPFKVRWATVRSNRFDSNALKVANPDLYAAFVRTTETRRFVVA